jgi:signal transduction histidine kinase/DNA-binding response OmpR family regulator
MAGTRSGGERSASGNVGPGDVWAINRLVLLAAVPLFLVLAVFALLALRFAASEREAQAWVRHTYQVMEAERRLQDDVQTAETGMRGFILSRDPSFETGFRADLARIPYDLRSLRDLTADNPSQQARASRLQKLLEARARGFEAAVRGNIAPVIRTPEAVAGLQRGRQEMTAIRAEVARGLAEEQRLLEERERDRRGTENLEVSFAVGAGALTLGILLLAAVLLVRNNISLAAAEKARANEAAILKATLETVREGIAYFSSTGVLCAFNSRFPVLLDLPDSLVRPQKTQLADYLTLERASFRPIFEAPADTDGADSTHISWGERELDIYRAPVATGGFIIGVVDITARLRAEEMMRQSQKMEAIGHLTGGVAHDFNNLLQVISANLDLAGAGDAARTDQRLKERLANAASAVLRGSRLTGQLLAFARRQALEPKSIDLGRVIRDMSDMLRRTLGETIAVETVIAGGLWNTLADPGQVENTVLNLAINARDAMPNGGKLTLEVANAYLDDTYAAAHGEVAPDQYVMLAVTDTGAGMTPDVMRRVFEPFFTTKPEGKGTGLGLAQIYGFVKQSGGHVKIYSEVGHGTTVKMYLPRTRRETDALETRASLPAEGGHERVLVVEDDADVRAAVVDMLADLGYEVEQAENAEDALALAGKRAPDMIFTDVVMPGSITTREFTRRAKAMHPKIRILYTSGYTQNAIVHNGKLDDDALLLSKPYRKDELARKLRSVFAGTACGAMSPSVMIAGSGNCQGRGKVLVVEDVALIRVTTMDMAEQLGFEALEAPDAQDALALLKQDPDITILLTDLGLPGMNGRELVEEALRLKPGLKVVIATGYSARESEGMARAQGIGYLIKPFDMEQLRNALES